MTLRVGHGLDAHRFAAGRPLMLGCVQVEYDRGLLGHSDGDAVAHALCDALLGAAGLGDMGGHFPSSESRWAGVGGATFLEAVAVMLADRAARVLSAHVVVVAEEPRLRDQLGAMAAACAQALGIDAASLVVTATTTDGMGFIGRGEGIAASAMVLLDVG